MGLCARIRAASAGASGGAEKLSVGLEGGRGRQRDDRGHGGTRGMDQIKDREADILEVLYFHVVFTVPEEVGVIAYQSKAVVASAGPSPAVLQRRDSRPRTADPE
jgi:hypothetical protein